MAWLQLELVECNIHTPFTARNVSFAELETDREQRSFYGHTEGSSLPPFVHGLNSELCIFTYLVLIWSMTCSGWFADFNWRFCSMQYLTVIQFTTLYIRGANHCPCTHLPVLLVAAAINNFRQATCSSGLADLLSGYPKVGTVVWLSYSLALASGLAEDGCCMLVASSSWGKVAQRAFYCCCSGGRQNRCI